MRIRSAFVLLVSLASGFAAAVDRSIANTTFQVVVAYSTPFATSGVDSWRPPSDPDFHRPGESVLADIAAIDLGEGAEARLGVVAAVRQPFPVGSRAVQSVIVDRPRRLRGHARRGETARERAWPRSRRGRSTITLWTAREPTGYG